MVKVILPSWTGGGTNETNALIAIMIEEATSIHVTAGPHGGFYLSLLRQRGGGDPVAVFNEWVYAEVIKEEVNFVRGNDTIDRLAVDPLVAG